MCCLGKIIVPLDQVLVGVDDGVLAPRLVVHPVLETLVDVQVVNLFGYGPGHVVEAGVGAATPQVLVHGTPVLTLVIYKNRRYEMT